MSDRPENLEAIELRLKNDILAEAVRCACFSNLTSMSIKCVSLSRFGGLILTHNEIGEYLHTCCITSLIKIILALEDGDGAILPTWTAADSNNVRTSRELWEYMKKEGWSVEVRTHIFLPVTLNHQYISITGMHVSANREYTSDPS